MASLLCLTVKTKRTETRIHQRSGNKVYRYEPLSDDVALSWCGLQSPVLPFYCA